jgi:hypothetical protein
MNARDRGGGFDKSSGFCSHMPLALQSVSKGQAFLPALLRRLAFFRLTRRPNYMERYRSGSSTLKFFF